MNTSHTNWNILALEIDKPSIEVANALHELWPEDITRRKALVCAESPIRHQRLVSLLEEAILPLPHGTLLTTYGSGYCHNLTSALLTVVADPLSKQYCYVHIDQHADNDEIKDHLIDCANFVSEIPYVTNTISVKHIGSTCMAPGIEPKDHVSVRQLQKEGTATAIAELFADTPQDTYVSIDLDVLLNEDMHTDFPDGEMPINMLLNVLRTLKTTRNLIGVDVLGLSYRYYQPSYNLFQKSKLVYAMIAGIFLGKDIIPLKAKYDAFTEQESKIPPRWMRRY